MSKPIYIPKGSMCMACVSRDEDCSGYVFESMPVLEKVDDSLLVVKCEVFEHANSRATTIGGNDEHQ